MQDDEISFKHMRINWSLMLKFWVFYSDIESPVLSFISGGFYGSDFKLTCDEASSGIGSGWVNSEKIYQFSQNLL